MDDQKAVAAEIEAAYLEAIQRSGEALKFIHDPHGLVKRQVLKFSIPFFNLFQHTHHIPEVYEQLKNGNGRVKELEWWFYSQNYSPDLLRRGLELFSWYQKTLLDARVIKIERQ